MRWIDGDENGLFRIDFEEDPRHAEIIIRTLELQHAKSVKTPGVKRTVEELMIDNKPIDAKRRTVYRSCTMRSSYICPGRPDIVFAVKELAKNMQEPKEHDWERTEEARKVPSW